MIYRIIDLPPSMIGFNALWEITRQDFEEVVIPCVRNCVEKKGHLNYLFVLDNSVRMAGAANWISDTFVLLRRLTRWKRAAIVSDSKTVQFLSGIYSRIVPGEIRQFDPPTLQKAIEWLAESDIRKKGAIGISGISPN